MVESLLLEGIYRDADSLLPWLLLLLLLLSVVIAVMLLAPLVKIKASKDWATGMEALPAADKKKFTTFLEQRGKRDMHARVE